LAVKLRLRRMGKKKQPVYKVVAADARSPRDGKFLEAIGVYNPLTDPFTLEIKEDRALYWLNVGAQPTDTVKSLLSRKGILLRRDLTKRGVSEEKIQEQMSNWAKQHEAKAQSKISKKQKSSVKEEVKDSTTEVKGAASEENSAAE
jgi:small subunit ribosomal protein S16